MIQYDVDQLQYDVDHHIIQAMEGTEINTKRPKRHVLTDLWIGRFI